MSERYFRVGSEEVVAGAAVSLVEADKVIDINDSKWAYPEIADGWEMQDDGLAACVKLWNPAFSDEERLKAGEEMHQMYMKMFWDREHTCDIQKYIVPGCVEEPDAAVEVLVFTPKNAKKKKNRAMFWCMGGALVGFAACTTPLDQYAEMHNCVLVLPVYRLAWKAKYPAAINDLHAAYQWMLDNADMLKINPKNVVVVGNSSGGHLGLSVCFRLKRYGIRPKGVVAIEPQTDDREQGEASFYSAAWDSIAQRESLMLWLGNNFCSSRVGPEALANHASVKDCIGYPPCFIHTGELDPDRDNSRAFYAKLLSAQSYAEYHCWGGTKHESKNWTGTSNDVYEETEYSKIMTAVVHHNIESCFKYDLSRPWTEE